MNVQWDGWGLNGNLVMMMIVEVVINTISCRVMLIRCLRGVCSKISNNCHDTVTAASSDLVMIISMYSLIDDIIVS